MHVPGPNHSYDSYDSYDEGPIKFVQSLDGGGIWRW